MELKCNLVQTADKKLWFLMKRANCSNGGSDESAESNSAPAEPEDDQENIPHPSLELWRHTMLRGANAGSFLAIIFGTPVLLFKGARKPAELLRRLARASTYGVGIGMGLTAVLTYARVWDQTDEQMYDRAYRLRYNKGQVLMDKMTYAGVLTGGLAGVAAMPSAWAVGGLQGACLGAGLAVFAQVLTKSLTRSKEE